MTNCGENLASIDSAGNPYVQMPKKPTLDSDKTWYLVEAKPQQESLAAFNLKNQGFCVFLPKVHKTVRHARKTTVRAASLFPGYLFVEASSRVSWSTVKGTFGAKRMVTNGDGPVALVAGFVEALKARAGSDDIIDFSIRSQLGDFSESAGAALAKKISDLASLNDQGRIFALMEFLDPLRRLSASQDGAQ